MDLNTEVTNTFRQEVFKAGFLGPPKAPLPIGTKIIENSKFCLSLYSIDFPTPSEFENDEAVRIVERGSKPIFMQLFQNFTREISPDRFEFSEMSPEISEKKYIEYTHNFAASCQSLGESIVRRVNKQSPIYPIKGELANDIGYLVQYVARDLPLNAFAEACLRCFFAGGVPCGWMGGLPDGQVVCYWPHDEAPTFSDNVELPWHKHMTMREGSYLYRFPKKIING